jgi:mRNA-degrading endonuclease HigB of HigAB toxin-antitoxin module
LDNIIVVGLAPFSSPLFYSLGIAGDKYRLVAMVFRDVLIVLIFYVFLLMSA